MAPPRVKLPLPLRTRERVDQRHVRVRVRVEEWPEVVRRPNKEQLPRRECLLQLGDVHPPLRKLVPRLLEQLHEEAQARAALVHAWILPV